MVEKKFEEKAAQWKKIGKSVIYPENYDKWDKYVDASISNNQNLYTTIKIMKLLENESIEQAKKLFESKKYNPSLSKKIRNVILEFSKKGPEFYEFTSKTPLNKEDTLKIENQKKLNAMYEKEQKSAIDRIPYWIDTASTIIFPQRMSSWKQYLQKSAKGLYHGKDIDESIEIMKKIESGESMDKIKSELGIKTMDRKLKNIVIDTTFKFSKKGPEFLEKIFEGNLSPSISDVIAKRKKENELYLKKEEKHAQNMKNSNKIFSILYPDYDSMDLEEKNKLESKKAFLDKHIQSVYTICNNLGLESATSREESVDLIEYVINLVESETEKNKNNKAHKSNTNQIEEER